MPDFLLLPADERSRILRAISTETGRTTTVLEKDIWVCWVLQQLFTLPNKLPMAFKGGTSLSKVFQAISRFSEDVDITLDYRGLNASLDPFEEGLSGRQLRKISDELKAHVKHYVHSVIAPYFTNRLEEQFPTESWRIELDDDGEQLRIHYPGALKSADGYISNSILLEFGGRNTTTPNEEHEVSSDIATFLPNLSFPTAIVNVLSPERTFWEKATLIHVECNRSEFRESAERLSRHWYDLFMLMQYEVGEKAIKNRVLLADVIKHKKVFYNASYANYDDCLTGKLRLVPDKAIISALLNDFDKMVRSGMFAKSPPSFDDILHKLQELETIMNSCK